MNNKANSMIWAVLIQLVLVALIVFAIYQVSSEFVSGETFELDLHVNEQTFLAEAMTARNTGIIQLHTFSTNDYATSITQEHVQVGLGEQAQKYERIHIPILYDISEQTILGRGVRWTRSAEILRINALSAQRECPAAVIEFESVVLIGEKADRELIKTELRPYFEEDNIHGYLSLSEYRNEDLLIRLDVQDRRENVLYTGTGTQNERMQCILTKYLEQNGIEFVVEPSSIDEPQIHMLFSPGVDSIALSRAMYSSFEELMQE